MTHILLDKHTQKIIYRSPVRPIITANPKECSKIQIPKVPTVFIRSRQDDDDPCIVKPKPEFDPDDLIDRTFFKKMGRG